MAQSALTDTSQNVLRTYEKLIDLLRELFQIDQPDLDFGIYRVMQAKRDEMSHFLDEELLPQVQSAFTQYRHADKIYIEKELFNAIEQARALGVDPEMTQKVNDLRARLEEEAVDLSALETAVYEHLFSFFRRYYADGDFLSKRVYKQDVYAIPYEGEEVTLHWANKDQYYIKTNDYLRNYVFRLRPHDSTEVMRVHFRLFEATEDEHGNAKAGVGRSRVFVLRNPSDGFVSEEGPGGNRELVILFEYRPALMSDWSEEERPGKKRPPVQKNLIAATVKRILELNDPSYVPWIQELGKPHVMASGEVADYSRLEAHLRRYTARNTFDYFIHRDLRGFLLRELDFFLKNEVMHLDDIENESKARVEQYLSKIRVVRHIGRKIIDFVAQLEEFQKRLWLKRKFVVETQYCIALGCISESFYAEIATCTEQIEEWRTLFAIDESPDDLFQLGDGDRLGLEFFKANPTLVVDTRNFDADFTARLLGEISDLDAQTDGVLFHGESFQALSLMQAKHRGRVKCIYIDPPYNAKTSEILYKNNYKHASWLSLLRDRSELAATLREDDGLFICAIDENEQERLGLLFDGLFPSDERVCVSVVHNPRGIQGSGFSFTHEFAYFLYPSGLKLGLRELDDAKSKPLMKTGSESERTTARNCFYPIIIRNGNIVDFGDVPSDDWHPRASSIRHSDGTVEVWPISSSDGLERKWRYSRMSIESVAGQLEIRRGRDGTPVPYLAKDYESYRTVWNDAEFNAAEHGSTLLKNILGALGDFSFPKSIWTVWHSLKAARLEGGDLALDFFAGSGTTGHAVIDMNRQDGARRRFILVEMADYFDTVLLPRVKRVTFTPSWRDGKPSRPATAVEAARSPRIMKVVRLESYEDSLNNLITHRTKPQRSLLETHSSQGPDNFKEQYILRYMLDVETRGSQSLLNVQAFNDPASYKLTVKRPGSDESRVVNVDLLETFNWLIGLSVARISSPQTFSAHFQRDSEGRLRIEKDRLRLDPTGPYWFRTVTGTTANGRRALVIWRKLLGEPEKDNLVLDKWFNVQGYMAKDNKFDLIYINGDNNLENLKEPDDLWRVRLIEEDFHRLMFEES